MRRLLGLLFAALVALGPLAAAAQTPQQKIILLGRQARPAVDINPVLGALPSTIAFARAGPATFYNSAGLLATASSGAPRFDYDPTTLAARGLLVEATARTNLMTQSQFASGWSTGVNASITQAAAVGPDGVAGSAIKIVEAATTAQHLAFKASGAFTAGTTVTPSAFIKQGERTTAWLQTSDATFVNGFRLIVNLATCAITGSGAFGTGTLVASSATAQSLPNGWCRVGVSGTVDPATSTTATVGIYLNSGANYAGDGTSGLFAFGADLQVGGVLTSYIPTTAAAVTRPAETATLALSGIPWNAGAGAILTDFIVPTLYTNNGRVIGSNTNAAPCFPCLQTTGPNRLNWIDNGTINLVTTGGGMTLAATNKAGGSWGGGASLVLNGGTVASSTSAPVMTGETALSLGGGAGTDSEVLWFKRLRIFNRRPPDGQLQALTR